MPRPTLFDHPKFQRLAKILSMPRPHVLGHLEFMWRVGYSSGNAIIGDEIDVELAAEWAGEPGAFVRALCDPAIRLLDKGEDGRYEIHDLHDHAPRYVQERWRKEQERKHLHGRTKRRTRGGHVADKVRTTGSQRAQTSSTPAPAPAPALAPTPSPSPAHAPPDERVRDDDWRVLTDGGAWNPKGGLGIQRSGLYDGIDARTHRNLHAWCGRVCVPRGLHLEFVKRLAGEDREDRVRAWYPTVFAKYEGREIGDTLWTFWQNEFASWVGTVTSKPATGSRTGDSMDAAKASLRERLGKIKAEEGTVPHDRALKG